MESEYGNDFVTVVDEDGNEIELEHLDTAEIDDNLYMAFIPADVDEDDEDFGLIILKVVSEDGEEAFTTIEDEEELQKAFDLFMERNLDEEDD